MEVELLSDVSSTIWPIEPHSRAKLAVKVQTISQTSLKLGELFEQKFYALFEHYSVDGCIVTTILACLVETIKLSCLTMCVGFGGKRIGKT